MVLRFPSGSPAPRLGQLRRGSVPRVLAGGSPLLLVYFEKIRALKAGVWPCRLQHGIIEYDLGLILLVSLAEVMIKRSDWGRSDSTARGENLGFVDDDLQRKHSARTLSLIKNESWGIEGD